MNDRCVMPATPQRLLLGSEHFIWFLILKPLVMGSGNRDSENGGNSFSHLTFDFFSFLFLIFGVLLRIFCKVLFYVDHFLKSLLNLLQYCLFNVLIC